MLAQSEKTISYHRQGNKACKPLRVRNCVGGTLNWTVSEGCDWLTLDPSTGTSKGENDKVNICVDTTGMEKGAYPFTVTITGAGASNSPQAGTIMLIVK